MNTVRRVMARVMVTALAGLLLSACGSTTIRDERIIHTQETLMVTPHTMPPGTLLVACDCAQAQPYSDAALRSSLCLTSDSKHDAKPSSARQQEKMTDAGRQYCRAHWQVRGSGWDCAKPRFPPAAAEGSLCAMDLPEAQRQLDRLACAAVCAAPMPQAKP